MKDRFYYLLILLLTTSCCTNDTSCIAVRLWDGYYSSLNASNEFNKKEKEFYENEPQETKLLRVKNEQYCDRLTNPMFYNKKSKYGDDYRVNMSDIFVHCMRVNGTPLYKDIPKKYEWLTDEDVRIK